MDGGNAGSDGHKIDHARARHAIYNIGSLEFSFVSADLQGLLLWMCLKSEWPGG